MFNNYLYRYSSVSEDVNYFFNVLRSENIDSEKLLDEYLKKVLVKFPMSDSARDTTVNNLKLLFSNPSIVNEIDELLNIFHHYNLNVKSVYDIRNRSGLIYRDMQDVIQQSVYSFAVEVNTAKQKIMNYEILSSLDTPEKIEKWNNNYGGNLTPEIVNKDLSNLEPNISHYRDIVENYKAHIEKIKSEYILPPFNHSIKDLEDVSKLCEQKINIIRYSLPRDIDFDKWLKFITSMTKYLKPLFQKVVIEEPKIEEPILEDSEQLEEIEKPVKNQQVLEILKLGKDDFIREYLKLSHLENLHENYDFIKKLEYLWSYFQKDPKFIDKLNDYENIVLNGKRVDFQEISKYLNNYKPFSLKDGPGGRGIFWYHDNIDRIKEGSPEFEEYKKAEEYVKWFDKNYKDPIARQQLVLDDHYYKTINVYKTFRKLRRRLENVKEWWDRISKIGGTEYGVRVNELFDIYIKIKKDFSYLGGSMITDLLDYFDDAKFKKIFDDNCEYNNSEKFELLLENFVAGNINQRAQILGNLFPDKFIKIIKTKYPDFLSIMQTHNYSLSFLEHIDLLGIGNKVIKSLNLSERDIKKVSSKHFSEFNLNNSSIKERELFDNFERLDLYPVPASQSKNIIMNSDGVKKTGFRIDFLLPCNVRKYDNDGNYTLQRDIIFVGEYFGYYGIDYEEKTKTKTKWQNMIESSVNQRCLHIKNIKINDLCYVLKEKNIDCKCYGDYEPSNFDITDDRNRKVLFIRTQTHNFVYTYLINELLWRVGYDYSKLSNENLESLKARNKVYLDEFQNLLLSCDDYSAKDITRKCYEILAKYESGFKREQKKPKTVNYRLNLK